VALNRKEEKRVGQFIATLKKTACPNCKKRTLWEATLNVQGSKQVRLFRSTDDFSEASTEAARLLEGSPAAEMTGAFLIGIEKVSHIWN